MFKERIGAIIISLYLRLHHYKSRGGDLTSLVEQGKQQLWDNTPESIHNVNTSAKEMFFSTAEGARDVVMNPGQTAGDVVEKVSEKIVDIAMAARDVLRGEKGGAGVKEVVKDTVESAKGEVKVAVERAKKK